MSEGRDWSKVRKILLAASVVFSLIVFITACVWVADFSWAPVNFALFTGLTAFLISLGLLFAYIKVPREDNSTLILVELVILVIWWIFILSAAAATADAVSTVDGCDFTIGGRTFTCYGGADKGALQACCAFCWFLWAVWTALLAFLIIDDVLGKKALNSKPSGGVDAPTGTVPPPPAPAAPAVAQV